MGVLTERSEDDDEERGDISIAGLDHLDADSDEITYELDEWSERDRGVLQERLETLGVPHHWEELTLVVAATDEAWVERVMDQVEEALSVALDPDTVQVAYDLSDWEADHREQLLDLLEADAVAYGIDGDELFVHEIDEQRVDEMIDAVLRPGEAPTSAAAAGPEVMGDLFVAADRLVHAPLDADGTLALIAAIRTAGDAAPPYGMDKVWWDSVLAQADQLVVHIDAATDDELIIEAATALRDTLRPYV